MTNSVELYTATGCEFSAEAREDLEWRSVDFVEYDVEKDREAYERMLGTTGHNLTVPVIVEEGSPHKSAGWAGGALSRGYRESQPATSGAW